MTIFRTAYDTTVCSGFQMGKTIDAIENAIITNWVNEIEGTDIYCIQNGLENIPSFSHPLVVKNVNKEDELVVDLRHFGTYSAAQAEFNIRNQAEYNFAVHRAKLNRIWLSESPTLLRDLSPLPMGVFCSWISEQVGRRKLLDAKEQFNILIICGIYYSCLFMRDDADFNDREQTRIASVISRSLRVQIKDILPLIKEVGPITGASMLCDKIAQHSGSVRLEDMNVGLLISIIKSSWFGTNAEETLGVALEHPPTWMAILSAAFTERSSKNSAIAKLVERSSFREAGKDYVRSVLNLLEITKTIR